MAAHIVAALANLVTMLTLPLRIEVPPPECRESGQGPALAFYSSVLCTLPERNGLAASGALDGLSEIGIGADRAMTAGKTLGLEARFFDGADD